MKIFEGKIISTQMNNTVVVEIFRVTPHPLYRKLIRRSKKYKVDNTGFEKANVGSVVKIQETKPMSKHKYFKILNVVSMGEGLPVAVEETKKEVKVTEKVEAKAVVKKPTKKVAKPIKASKAKKENK